MSKKLLNLWMDEDLKEWLKARAAERRTSMARELSRLVIEAKRAQEQASTDRRGGAPANMAHRLRAMG